MSEVKLLATELTSQYTAQVTGDLERNTKEQDRIGGEIQALQELLRALQRDHSVLMNMRQALGGSSPAAKTATAAAQSVPRQAVAEPKADKPKKTAAKTTAPKKSAAKASSAKASKPATEPTLVEVIRGYLEQQSEPRSAAEVSAALTQAHPDRTVKTTVVRTTLEGLVAKNHAQRNKQGSSVFYTASAAQERAAAESQQEAAAG